MTTTLKGILVSVFLSGQICGTTKLIAQAKKINLGYDQIYSFINPKDNKVFFHQLPDSSTLFILDPERLLQNCNLSIWKNHKIEILTNGSWTDSIRHFEPHFVFRNRCEYLLLSTSRYQSNMTIILHHLCSNEFCSSRLKKRKDRYVISEIESGVY